MSMLKFTFDSATRAELAALSKQARYALANGLVGAALAQDTTQASESARYMMEFADFLRSAAHDEVRASKTGLELLVAAQAAEIAERITKLAARSERLDATLPWAADLHGEIRRGMAKFPRSRFMLFALLEEVGELIEAVVNRRAVGDVEVRREALQVAAVAVRIAEEGDETHYGSSAALNVAAWLGEYVRLALQRGDMDAVGVELLAAAARLCVSGDHVLVTADGAASKK
jgi:hypothetical protein